MKSRLVMTALAATLLASAGVASAQQQYYWIAQVPGQVNTDIWTQSQDTSSMTQNTTGDSSSYSGMTMDSRGMSGMGGMSDSTASKPSTRGPQCYLLRQLSGAPALA